MQAPKQASLRKELRTLFQHWYKRKGWLIALVLILLCAYTFRLWRLGAQSLWHDEAWSVFQAYTPLHWLDPNYPPAYTLLLGGWLRLTGDEVWTMRYFTLLFGLCTVAAGALLARRWYGPRAGVLAAILLAASPTLWVYSQEIRSYVVMPLLTIILLALVDRLTRPQRKIPHRTWVWILLVEILALYTHNLGVPLTAWLNIAVAAIWLWRREWRRLFFWLLAQIGLLIVYLPWLVTQRPTGTALNTPPALGLNLLWEIWQSYFTGIKALIGADPLLMTLITGFGIIALIGIVAAMMLLPGQRTWLTLSQVILLPTFELIIILAAHIDFHPRYFILGIPPTLLLSVAGWAVLTRKVGGTSIPYDPDTDDTFPLAPQDASIYSPIPALLLTGVIIFSLAVTVRMVYVLYGNAGYQHDDFRAVAQHYAQLTSQDAIIIPYGWEPTIDYYSRKMNFKARFISLPLHSSAATIVNRLREDLVGVQKVEFLTWYQLPADVRGAYPCLLGTNRKQNGSLTFSGVNTTSYAPSVYGDNLPMAELTPSDVTFNFSGPILKLVDVQALSGYYSSCVITRWVLPAPTQADWSISMRALNRSRWQIARADTLLMNDRQVSTSLWKPQQIETAFSSLKLPEGAVGDNFPIAVTVYGDPKPSGLDALLENKPLGLEPEIASIKGLSPPDATAALTDDDQQLASDLYLHRETVPDPATSELRPGGEMRVTLEWWRTNPDDIAHVTVSLIGDGWRADSIADVRPAPKVLTWHALTVPARAKGKAILQVSVTNGQTAVLADYDFGSIERVFVAPVVAYDANAEFSSVGALVGYDTPLVINDSQNFTVSLLWKASETPTTAYTVFVHLLDENGQIVAQSDSYPANGTRPTTGWVVGEYIIDSHTLTFSRHYSGSATLEVGLYDSVTQKRILLMNGPDHVTLSTSIIVQASSQ